MPMREYECIDNVYGIGFVGKKILAPDKCCLFCGYCTDVWWDYTHGPYMLYCEIDCDTEQGAKGECEHFIDEEEVQW